MKMRIARKYLSPIALLLVSTIGVAYAATTLFTQTFPAIPGTTPALTASCTTLTAGVSSVIAGSSGFITFHCHISAPLCECPALSVSSATTATPTFTLPTGYTTLGLVGHLTPMECSSGNLGTAITSGSPVNFSGNALDDYCATYSNAPATGLATFDITWSQ